MQAATFGSLGAVIVLLLSFYLAGLAVLSGGVLNGLLERVARGETIKDSMERKERVEGPQLARTPTNPPREKYRTG